MISESENRKKTYYIDEKKDVTTRPFDVFLNVFICHISPQSSSGTAAGCAGALGRSCAKWPRGIRCSI